MILRYVFGRFQMVNHFTGSKSSFNFLAINRIKNYQFPKPLNTINYKYFHAEDGSKITGESTKSLQSSKKVGKINENKPILLMISNDEILLMKYEEAEKLAIKRNLNLVKVVDLDTKMKKPLYKLMTKSEFLIEESKYKAEKKKKNKSKDKKLFNVTTKISKHDLDTKIRQVMKHLQKNREVQISVSNDGNPLKAEEIAKSIEEDLSDISKECKWTKKHYAFVLHFIPKFEQENIVKDVEYKEKNLEKFDKA